MASLSVTDLKVAYQRVQALHGVDLALASGTLTCVLGPNGAGKTTLARTIAGALRAQSGQIRLDDRPITRWTPERRARSGIVLVPQGRCVFANLTVQQNLEVARFAAGRRRGAASQLAMELFPRLVSLRNRKAGLLSGGEQQMVAVARALAAEPRVLILDEPSLGLAPVVMESMYDAIRQVRKLDIAILLVEQLAELALEIADDVVVLAAGRVVARGRATEFDSAKLNSHYLGG